MSLIESQLKDFAKASLGLFWPRQATFAGATVLAAYYVNINIALICYGICQMSEFFDYSVARRVLDWDGADDKKAREYLNKLTLSSVLTSISVVQFVVVVALAEGPSLHMGPLFFLLVAMLYSAMNNCQIPRVLLARMIIFSSAFVLIPVYDLWVVRPPLHSELWKQFGIVLFVLYFLIECSRKFLANYETGLSQLEELRVERDRVAEAYKVQSQFVSVVSHELRTPLTSVKTSLDLINSTEIGELPEGLRAIARIGQKSSNHLALLIDDILDFQKLKAGKMSFRFALLELGEFVQEAVEVNRSFGEHRDVTVQVDANDARLHVNADSDRLMQVMANVLSNAIKFSHDGGRVDVAVERQQNKVRILIRDNGIGIPENSEHIVFGTFTQIDSSDGREFGGTGLGMAITKKIVEDHNGAIYYFSELGRGTTFVVELDLVPVGEAEASDARAELMGQAGATAATERGWTGVNGAETAHNRPKPIGAMRKALP